MGKTGLVQKLAKSKQSSFLALTILVIGLAAGIMGLQSKLFLKGRAAELCPGSAVCAVDGTPNGTELFCKNGVIFTHTCVYGCWDASSEKQKNPRELCSSTSIPNPTPKSRGPDACKIYKTLNDCDANNCTWYFCINACRTGGEDVAQVCGKKCNNQQGHCAPHRPGYYYLGTNCQEGRSVWVGHDPTNVQCPDNPNGDSYCRDDKCRN